jgi:hypothetical protein
MTPLGKAYPQPRGIRASVEAIEDEITDELCRLRYDIAVPVWTERKMPGIADRIAFMHIPKTAGVSVIDAFTDRLGAEACLPFSPTIADDDFSGKRFLSGHVYLGDITENAFLFTFLRDPVKQLASHLLWIDHYNMPEHEHKTAGLPASVREGIEALRGKDLSSARDLDRYLAGVPADSVLRIRNLQAELMSFRRGKVEAVGDKRLAQMAIGNLDRLSFVGLSESLAGDMAALFGMLGLGEEPVIKRLNGSPSTNHIDISAPAVRRVLESYVQADIRLYERVASMRSGGSWMDRAKRLLWRFPAPFAETTSRSK